MSGESGADGAHAGLVAAAAAWLRRQGCAVVITEMAHAGSETPDAIGWAGGGRSTVVECKASRADFLADRRKLFRRVVSQGMGRLRYYCAPRGVLSSDEMPPGWGLLEWDGRRMRVARKAEPQPGSSGRAEVSLLLSAIRRIGAGAPRGIGVRFYTYETGGRATLGASAAPRSGPRIPGATPPRGCP